MMQKNRSRSYSVRFLILVGLLGGWSGVRAAEDSAGTGPEDGYRFDWLDPDKKVYVLQNRQYRKAERAQLSLLAGLGISNPYRDTYQLEPRLSYFFTEELGIEGFYSAVFNTKNGTYDALIAASPSTLPVIREIRSRYGALLVWAPWYAKINVFNKILYFDWYFTVGVGQVHTEVDINTVSSQPARFIKQDRFAGYVGTGHQFYVAKDWVVRLDFLSAIYSAPVLGNSGSNELFTDVQFALGAGVRL